MLWRSRGDVRSLNLLYGAGGREHAPDARGVFTFLKEDLNATSPKFDVRDSRGVEWKVKLDEEPQSETAATRFLWAAGYFVDEDYYLPELRVNSGIAKMRRGRNFITNDGRVKRARLERKIPEVDKKSTWNWFDNPFIGTREFNGLRTMVSFLNDWDLKAVNNSVYTIAGEHRYLISDVGATFGRTGSLAGTQSSPRDYAASTFILRTTPELVDFEMRGRPFFVLALAVPNYIERSRMEAITRGIPRGDARWLGQRLALLSDQQIRDAFRGAGYTAEEVASFTTTVKKRIAALVAL